MSALLELNDLKKHFLVRSGPLGLGTTTVRAVDGVSFHIDRGETLALVGDLLRQNPLPRSQFGSRRRFPSAASQRQTVVRLACRGQRRRGAHGVSYVSLTRTRWIAPAPSVLIF